MLDRILPATKKATSSGQIDPQVARLALEDGDARLQVRGLDGHRKPPAEARAQALLQAGKFLREAVAGEDDLLPRLEQRVEGMEELLLGALLAGEELDIVDEQGVDRAVVPFELVDAVMLQGLDHLRDEALRVQVDHPGLGIGIEDGVTDGVHQVGLAEPDTAVDEQRVVGDPRVVADLDGGRPGDLVGLALDEGIEGKLRVQAALPAPLRASLRDGQGAAVSPALPASGRRGVSPAVRASARARVPTSKRQAGDGPLAQVGAELQELLLIVLTDPVADEAVGGEQMKLAIGLGGLEGQDPGVELRRVEVALEQFDAFLPDIHGGVTPVWGKATPGLQPQRPRGVDP